LEHKATQRQAQRNRSVTVAGVQKKQSQRVSWLEINDGW